MTIQQAIEKAIEGGYDVQFSEAAGLPTVYVKDGYQVDVAVILLDPLFWQSLGKAMGWENCERCEKPFEKHQGYLCVIQLKEGQVTTADVKTFRDQNWKVQWHRFIDHLADGGSAESFFENL